MSKWDVLLHHSRCLVDSVLPGSSSKFLLREQENRLCFSVQAFHFKQDSGEQVTTPHWASCRVIIFQMTIDTGVTTFTQRYYLWNSSLFFLNSSYSSVLSAERFSVALCLITHKCIYHIAEINTGSNVLLFIWLCSSRCSSAATWGPPRNKTPRATWTKPASSTGPHSGEAASSDVQCWITSSCFGLN